MGQSADNPAIEKLKEIESKVARVVADQTKTCVAINDGTGFGSGVIVSKDGLVLTAGHVLASPDTGQYEVIMPSGRTVRARLLGVNLDVDAGMMQLLEPGPWPFVELERTQSVANGDWVVLLGHSGGFELGRDPPVRTGRLLARRDHQLLTDAVLIGGDSGGPLFNLDGKLIGIHSSIGDSVAENRHVAIDIFLRDWNRLLSGDRWGRLPSLNEPDKQTRRGRIGIKLDLTASNALVRAIDAGMPADSIGIEVGDVVAVMDRMPVRDGRHLIELVKRKRAGDVVSLTILRNGQRLKFEVLLK